MRQLETVKLSTIIKVVNPDLRGLLTFNELNMPVVLKNGIESVTSDDILEIIQASILQKSQGALILQ